MVGNVTGFPGLTPFARPNAVGARREGAETAPSATESTVLADQLDAASPSSYAAQLVASRRELVDAGSAIDLAVANARQARTHLAEAGDLATRAAAPEAPNAAREAQDVAFKSALQSYGRAIEGATVGGASLLAGDPLSIRPDPASEERLSVAGADLRLKARPADADAIQIPADASVATFQGAQGAARAIEESLKRLDSHVGRLEDFGSGLEAHDRVLSALRAAVGSSAADLDADGARLMALQVKQSLAGATGPIGNANGVLSHFKA